MQTPDHTAQLNAPPDLEALTEAELVAVRERCTAELGRRAMARARNVGYVSTAYPAPTKRQLASVLAQIKASSSPRTYDEVLVSAAELARRRVTTESK